MKAFLEIYYQIIRKLLIIMVCVLIVPVLLQVISRFIPFIPRFIWTEEIARFAFIWIIMLGSIIAVRDGTHFSVDILGNLSPGLERKLEFLLLMILLIFSIVFMVGGWQFAEFGRTQQSEISALPMLAIYISWPLAGLSWIMFIMEKLYDFFLADQNEADGTS